MSTEQLSDILPERESLSDRFVAHLAREFVAGTYKPGSNLPPEAALCLRYGVSKPTLRQGLTKLQALGMIRIRQGKRSVVLDEVTWNVLDPVIHQAFSAAGRASELAGYLWEVRRLLETETAALVAERASDVEIAELRKLADQLWAEARDTQDVEQFLRVDQLFHDLISRASRNPALRCIFDPTYRFIAQQLWSPGSHARQEDLVALAEQHDRIALAISARDAAAAREAMSRHIAFAQNIEFSDSPR